MGRSDTGEMFQKLLSVVPIYSHLSLKQNPKELLPKQRPILNALEISIALYVCVQAFTLRLFMYVCIAINISVFNKQIHTFLLSACFSRLAHSLQTVSNLGHFCPSASFPVQCNPN